MLEVTALLERLKKLDHLVDAIFFALQVALFLLEGRLLVELAEVHVRPVEELLGYLVLKLKEPARLLQAQRLKAPSWRYSKATVPLVLAHRLRVT